MQLYPTAQTMDLIPSQVHSSWALVERHLLTSTSTRAPRHSSHSPRLWASPVPQALFLFSFCHITYDGIFPQDTYHCRIFPLKELYLYSEQESTNSASMSYKWLIVIFPRNIYNFRGTGGLKLMKCTYHYGGQVCLHGQGGSGIVRKGGVGGREDPVLSE